MKTKNWATKSVNRGLITQEEYDALMEKLKYLHH